jgi:hypothetical protein
MRYRLHTLMILLAVGPPLMAVGWRSYVAYRNARDIAALKAAIDSYRTKVRFPSQSKTVSPPTPTPRRTQPPRHGVGSLWRKQSLHMDNRLPPKTPDPLAFPGRAAWPGPAR